MVWIATSTPTGKALVSHRNAPLTETGRLRLARCVVVDGWPLRRAAERFQVSPTTAARWAARYRLLGEAGMVDRSSRPHHSPGRTPTRTERRIIKVRVLRRWGPARIAHLLGLVPSTVHRVLTRYRLARLTHLDRATGRNIRRYERDKPGELVHVVGAVAPVHPTLGREAQVGLVDQRGRLEGVRRALRSQAARGKAAQLGVEHRQELVEPGSHPIARSGVRGPQVDRCHSDHATREPTLRQGPGWPNFSRKPAGTDGGDRHLRARAVPRWRAAACRRPRW